MADNNLKLTEDVFDYIHYLRKRYPDMTYGDIAESVKGKFKYNSFSSASAGVALRYETYDLLEEFRASKRVNHREDNTSDNHDDSFEKQLREIIEVDDSLILDGITKTDDDEFINEEETPEIISTLAFIEGLFSKYFVSKGSGTYPDETVGTKLNGIAAGINCTKKEFISFTQVLIEMIDDHHDDTIVTMRDMTTRITDALYKINDTLTSVQEEIKNGNDYQRTIWESPNSKNTEEEET